MASRLTAHKVHSAALFGLQRGDDDDESNDEGAKAVSHYLQCFKLAQMDQRVWLNVMQGVSLQIQ